MRESFRMLALSVAVVALLFSLAANAASAFPPLTFSRRIDACVSCHGPRGEGSVNDYYPRLADQPSAYMEAQLEAFQRGTRVNKVMQHMVARLPTRYLWAMADYFSQRSAPYPPVRMNEVTSAEMMRGKLMVTRGRWLGGIPACTTCHGDKLQGSPPGTPLLAGQYESYLADQLGAWRSGQRRSDPDGLMRWVAFGLSDRDIDDISAYLASLRPAQALPGPVSLRYRKNLHATKENDTHGNR